MDERKRGKIIGIRASLFVTSLAKEFDLSEKVQDVLRRSIIANIKDALIADENEIVKLRREIEAFYKINYEGRIITAEMKAKIKKLTELEDQHL